MTMSLGPLMVDLAGVALDATEREILVHPLVGGVILFSRNFVSRSQLAALTADIHALRSPALLVAVDHEGGRVQRFRAGFTDLPAMATLGSLYDREPASALALAVDVGWLLAAELRAVGVDFSFAPVLDLYTPSSRVIRERAFHADPSVVARLAQALVRGMHAAGMAAVGKHFPGHGTVTADSHHELPIDGRDLAEVRQRDLLPFRLLCAAGIEAIMPAHILFPAVDEVAVGYSARWLQQVLRGELGFQGMIFSDDLSMSGAAQNHGPVARARLALAAGCDMGLLCNDRPAVEQVLDQLQMPVAPVSLVRMMRMHGRPGLAEAPLMASPRRAQIRAQLAAMLVAPSLALGDDAPA